MYSFAAVAPYCSIVPIAESPSTFALSRLRSLSFESREVISSKMCMSCEFFSRAVVRSAR